jgi:hypothetical protein
MVEGLRSVVRVVAGKGEFAREVRQGEEQEREEEEDEREQALARLPAASSVPLHGERELVEERQASAGSVRGERGLAASGLFA